MFAYNSEENPKKEKERKVDSENQIFKEKEKEMYPALANRRGDGKQHKYIQHSETEGHMENNTNDSSTGWGLKKSRPKS